MNLYWKIGIALVLAAAGAAYHYHVYQTGYDTAVAERAARDGVAVLHRTAENVVIADRQASINTVITKAKNEELAPVVQRIYVDRVRVGPGVCPATGSANPEGAGSGDRPAAGSGLVSQRTEADIRELDAKVETYLATARACQAFVRENGMVP